jgi:hypothetical protein
MVHWWVLVGIYPYHTIHLLWRFDVVVVVVVALAAANAALFCFVLFAALLLSAVLFCLLYS